MSSSIKVGVRVRPLASTESEEGILFESFDDTSLVFQGQTFTYDHVFDKELTQRDLYNETAAPMLKDFLEGYNVTIIAYGQTGSGKTFTMGTSDIEQGTDDKQGIIPRLVSDLFENLKTSVEGEKLIESKVTVSFLEIYGEDVYDLNCSGDPSTLTIRKDANDGFFVDGLQSIGVSSMMEALKLLTDGTKKRRTAATKMNPVSSRSHAIYTINLQQTTSSGDNIQQITSKVTFVDLAGSENLDKTGAEGRRKTEGIQINVGLFHLGHVINSLADNQKKRKVNLLITATQN
jgi:kinesin family protein 4/21/27